MGKKSAQTKANAGNGYVIKIRNIAGSAFTYARMYVVEPIANASGNVTGAKVKYQYPFKP